MPLESLFPKLTSYERRLEIDGLRGMAVVLVFINHIDSTLLQSGYVGVDVFFVISGYVVTRSLAAKKTKCAKSFYLDFIKRRIIRIYPALIAYIILASLSISFFNRFSQSALMTASKGLLGLANISLYRGSWDYFSQEAHLNPFTQLWSLSVEEQFYIAFPIIICLCLLIPEKFQKRICFFKVISILSLASFASFTWNSHFDVSSAYYLTWNRFWELGIGVLLYKSETLNLKLKGTTKNCLQLGSLAIIISSAFLPVSAIFFPIILACFGTVTFILTSSSRNFPSLAKKILLSPLFLHTGKISYSLYLWHWGVIVISKWTIGIHFWSVLIIVPLSFACAQFSYKYLESPRSPIRHLFSSAPIVFLFALLSSFAIHLISVSSTYRLLYLGKKHTIFHAADEQKSSHNSLSKSKILWSHYGNDVKDHRAEQQPKSITSGQKLLFIGDSHTEHLFELSKELTSKFGISTAIIYSPGVRFPTVNWSNPKMMTTKNIQHKNKEIEDSFELALNEMKSQDIVIISSSVDSLFQVSDPWPSTVYWNNTYNNVVSKKFAANAWTTKLDALVSRLQQKNINVVIFLPTPLFGYSNKSPSLEQCTLEWFNRTNFALREDCPQLLKPVSKSHMRRLFNPFLNVTESIQMKHSNVYLFDPLQVLCPKSICTTLNEQGQLLFADDDHLSPLGSSTLAYPLYSFLNSRDLLVSD